MMHRLMLALLLMVSGGCVQAPALKSERHALIISNYPIVRVDGEKIPPVFRLDLETGENTLVIVYHTYLNDYFCTFKWTAHEGMVYEVTDQENSYPLTLFRWVRTNSLWASRLAPMDPVDCMEESR